jgi:carbamoyltransferase
MNIIGISSYYHDAAAALIADGNVIAAAQEERFSRIKSDSSFPIHSIDYCLKEAGLKLTDIDAFVFYEKPFLKFERLIETYFYLAPSGFISFVKSIPSWLKEKLFLKNEIKKHLKAYDSNCNWTKTKILFSSHHLSHAASAFFVSNFNNSAILTIDGVGEWATSSIALGQDNKITTLLEMRFPNSVGLLYSSFTYFLGFEVNNGEYKVMGLAPFAEDEDEQVICFKRIITSNIVKIFEDGSIELNPFYFKYASSLKMIHEKRFELLLGIKIRRTNDAILKVHYCLAKALQLVLEDIVMKMAIKAKQITGSNNLCLAGGVALNCVANGKLLESNEFDNIYIQPAAGDAGGALGAALSAHHMYYHKPRKYNASFDLMLGCKLGPSFALLTIENALKRSNLSYKKLSENELIQKTNDLLINGNIIGWYQGRMEFGPRALGSRSIIANPLMPNTLSDLNIKVKKREGFRPFAPIMLKEEFERLFGQKHDSIYMLFVHKILPKYRIKVPLYDDDIYRTVNLARSVLPAITHVDYSSRIQTVTESTNKLMYQLLVEFKKRTGFGVLVNTSFNIKDEPIVCTPEDAINCFLNTNIDALIIENYLIIK